MFRSQVSSPSELAALGRVEVLVRQRYGLGEDQLVLVSEEPGREPGMPGAATTILFWAEDGVRRRIRLFKPARDVRAADLPPRWLNGALRDDGEADCC